MDASPRQMNSACTHFWAVRTVETMVDFCYTPKGVLVHTRTGVIKSTTLSTMGTTRPRDSHENTDFLRSGAPLFN